MGSTSPRIAVLGSINADFVIRCPKLPRPGETILADSSSEVAGGKGANQAVAAARLGGRVTMIGRVGDDFFGERLLSALSCDSLDISNVRRTTNCSSGMAVVAVEQSGENSILVVPGANGRISEDDVSAAENAIRSCDILLLQLEIPLPAVIAAMAFAQLHGVRAIINPAPAAKSLPPELLNVDVLCPNLAEAAALIGIPIHSCQDALEAAIKIGQLGPKATIITLGSQGAVLAVDGEVEWFEPFPVETVDSTAAGDAFAGALAVRLGEGASLGEAVRFGCAAGALTATRHGAQPSLPTRLEVDAFLVART